MFKDGIKLSENVYKLTASKIYLINELINLSSICIITSFHICFIYHDATLYFRLQAK